MSYANTWWNDRNSKYPDFGGTDCTNFVSQALYAGGYDMVDGAEDSPYAWWIRKNWYFRYDYTLSWSVAKELRKFLLNDTPGATAEGSAPGSSTNYWTPTNVTSGDVLFYNWGQGEGISHTAMQTGYGDDPNSNLSGNYVNQHSNDRRHAFWSLKPYNSYWRDTTISFVHILNTN